MEVLRASAEKTLSVHGIGGTPSAPKTRELWDRFHAGAGDNSVTSERLTIENRFYAGYRHSEIDWRKPVHGIFSNFKSDGMHMGMLVERLEDMREQYVFIGNPLGFNDGWHFTAVNDFEASPEQEELNPTWQNIRIWHRVNYVPSRTKDGLVALVPREEFDESDQTKGAIAIDRTFKLTSCFSLGGLVAGTLLANVVKQGSPSNELVLKHLELGTTFGSVGNGVGVFVGCGTYAKSAFSGFEIASSKFAVTSHLGKVSDITVAKRVVHPYKHAATGSQLVSIGIWKKDATEEWFGLLGLSPPSGRLPDSARFLSKPSQELMCTLDLRRTMKNSSSWNSANSAQPRVAVFLDHAFDPVEAWSIVTRLMDEDLSFQLISHKRYGPDLWPIYSETVFGNANYELHDCRLQVATTPADKVAGSVHFDSFAVVGGQGPFYLAGDDCIKRIINGVSIASAVCHGPMTLIGTKWIYKDGPTITAFNGCWIYFRHVLGQFQFLKPGEIVSDDVHKLYTGNAPRSSQVFVEQLVAEIRNGRRQTSCQAQADNDAARSSWAPGRSGISLHHTGALDVVTMSDRMGSLVREVDDAEARGLDQDCDHQRRIRQSEQKAANVKMELDAMERRFAQELREAKCEAQRLVRDAEMQARNSVRDSEMSLKAEQLLLQTAEKKLEKAQWQKNLCKRQAANLEEHMGKSVHTSSGNRVKTQEHGSWRVEAVQQDEVRRQKEAKRFEAEESPHLAAMSMRPGIIAGELR